MVKRSPVIPGARYGRLLVQRHARNLRQNRVWFCRCDCGGSSEVIEYNLKNGKTKSCGCLSRELTGRRFLTHGKSFSSEYWAWSNMIQRCRNPKNKRYKNYGQRGITVCDRWENSFAKFLSDMGPKPPGRYTLERIDNDGHYEPSNCKWATYKEQAQNQRHKTRSLAVGSRPITMQEIAERTQIPYGTIAARFRRGWTIDDATNTPVGIKRKVGAA